MTAAKSDVVIQPRELRQGQRSEVWIASPDSDDPTLIFESADTLLEAPNWTLDGKSLILNGAGHLWNLDIRSGVLQQIPLGGIPDLNNDHVLAPDGTGIYLSANDGHIYYASLVGGPTRRVTTEDGAFHFLHGVSPDGTELAFVAIDASDFTLPGRLMKLSSDGGAAAGIDVGPGHCDGPEYSPDGKWLYLNTESFSTSPGHAQLARIRLDGTGFEQVLDSDTVDWFPHVSPDGQYASYLRFPTGTEGHPADLPVAVVLVSTDDWQTPLQAWSVFGGQGTINVNSWSPDSTRLAFVAYPLDTISTNN
ncbi:MULTISPECIES: biopolymer transporter Tol [unclassified Arthrobacter]|uniref:TolB family protein n=1 Tax=unclassified Arthrobacter TaxID=235627 RepID=UPI002882F2EB|nr:MULTISPECIES: biopolymer transporter Tol [unclassified Arthrobacter]